jgi:N-methylhydantoinase A
MGFRVGIDTGGTFTDLFALDESGCSHIVKVPSTPTAPDRAVRDALQVFLDKIDGSPSSIESIFHGTTVGINAILQSKFAPIGLIVTKGFPHILEMGRQTIPGERGSIYAWSKPSRVVHLSNVEEVTERCSSKGEILTQLDEAECRAIAERFAAKGIDTIAVCLINAYAKGDHERRIREILLESYPSCRVSLSSETLPEYREYERAITTCMNALLLPILGQHIRAVQFHLVDLGITAPLYIMKSAGGATLADLAQLNPIHTALSGTASAVVGAAWIGRGAGEENLVTFDMGGTSTDVALIENGVPSIVSEVEIGDYPIRTPAIDVVSVGAGGGSIASLVPGNRFQVGPRSAGAEPGPACYGKGGNEATITDANVYLGRLPTTLAGGAVTLDRKKAEDALARLGENLDLDALSMARGILEIGEMNMADAVRQVSVQKGRDPRRFTLIAGGGAGPLHAASLGEILSMPRILIPPYPGIGCSLGALASNVREDFVMTDIHDQNDPDLSRLERNYKVLEARATERLDQQGVDPNRRVFLRGADLRYKGMRSEMTANFDPEELLSLEAVFDAMHTVHREAYGYDYEGVQDVEIVNLRVTGVGIMPEMAPLQGLSGPCDTSAALTGSRQVCFRGSEFIETPVYDRAMLTVGCVFIGPAIVEQYDCTVVVLPEQHVLVDAHNNLIITTRCANQSNAGGPH